MPSYDSAMCGFYCIASTEYMTAGQPLFYYAYLFYFFLMALKRMAKRYIKWYIMIYKANMTSHDFILKK